MPPTLDEIIEKSESEKIPNLRDDVEMALMEILYNTNTLTPELMANWKLEYRSQLDKIESMLNNSDQNLKKNDEEFFNALVRSLADEFYKK